MVLTFEKMCNLQDFCTEETWTAGEDPCMCFKVSASKVNLVNFQMSGYHMGIYYLQVNLVMFAFPSFIVLLSF
jgi:hypothetical protein